MPTMNVVEAIRDAMLLEMRRDPSVFVLGEDIGARGGVFLATYSLIEEFGEERVIDTPLAEASIIGIALGSSGQWHASHRRNPVRRLHLARHKTS